MNKLSCKVILDLLPLYADEVASPESRALVEEHLSSCPDCRKVLDDIRAEITVPQRNDDAVLDKIRKKQCRKRTIFGIFAAFWVILILFYPTLALYYQFRDNPTTGYGPENFIISETEDGKPLLLMDEEALGAMVYYLYERTAEGETNLYLYIYDRDSTPEWLHNLLHLQPPNNPFYLIYEIGPEYNLGKSGQSSNAYSSYLGVRGFILDESIQKVYYQSITPEQQNNFFSNYLLPYYMIPFEDLPEEVFAYRAPASEKRVLIWSSQ